MQLNVEGQERLFSKLEDNYGAHEMYPKPYAKLRQEEFLHF